MLKRIILVTFLIPVSALLLGVGVLDEVIHIPDYTGMGCIFLGLILIDGRTVTRLKRKLSRLSNSTELVEISSQAEANSKLKL